MARMRNAARLMVISPSTSVADALVHVSSEDTFIVFVQANQPSAWMADRDVLQRLRHGAPLQDQLDVLLPLDVVLGVQSRYTALLGMGMTLAIPSGLFAPPRADTDLLLSCYKCPHGEEVALAKITEEDVFGDPLCPVHGTPLKPCGRS